MFCGAIAADSSGAAALGGVPSGVGVFVLGSNDASIVRERDNCRCFRFRLPHYPFVVSGERLDQRQRLPRFQVRETASVFTGFEIGLQ
jgi:hypothetical protein